MSKLEAGHQRRGIARGDKSWQKAVSGVGAKGMQRKNMSKLNCSGLSGWLHLSLRERPWLGWLPSFFLNQVPEWIAIPPNNRVTEIRVSLMILFCAGVCVCVPINVKVGGKPLGNNQSWRGWREENWQLWSERRGQREADVRDGGKDKVLRTVRRGDG